MIEGVTLLASHLIVFIGGLVIGEAMSSLYWRGRRR